MHKMLISALFMSDPGGCAFLKTHTSFHTNIKRTTAAVRHRVEESRTDANTHIQTSGQ